MFLACAYLYSALMAGLHVATFPGAILAGEILVGGPQSVSWLFVSWKLGFALLVLCALLLRTKRRAETDPRARTCAGWAAALTVLICALLGGAIINGQAGLPASISSGERFLSLNLKLSWAACGVDVLGGLLALSKARRGDGLCVWLAPAMFEFAGESMLSIVGGSRFTVGWYVGRASGVLGAFVLFLMFLTLFVRQNRALAGALSGAEERAHALQAEIRRREEAEQRLLHTQKMEALGQLAGGVAHDLNNVLQAVQGGISVIQRRSSNPQSATRLLQVVQDAAERRAGITRRLLAFSRRGNIRPEPVDPVALLGNMRELLVLTLGAGVEVRLDLAPGLPPMMADKGQLETVLINLAINARDAMDGNGLLTLAARMDIVASGDCHPAGLNDGRYVLLSLTDTGVGMTPEILTRITEPFFTTKPAGKGTGLGLAMARGFAEQSGGALQAESTAGAGATMRLWFPIASIAARSTNALGRPIAEEPAPEDPDADWPAPDWPAPDWPAPDRPAPDRPALDRLESIWPASIWPAPALTPAPTCVLTPASACVLLVDDDPMVREVVAEGLRAEGYTTLTAVGGDEALGLLKTKQTVDVLISDLSMPGMDGLAVIGAAQRLRPKLPAILLTGFATAAVEVAMTGPMSGMFSLLRKPVSGPELAEHVELLLEGAART